jgi:hypothetical protein
VTLDLWSADWKLAAGHRIAVRVTDTNTDWWAGSVGTQQPVTVKSGTLALPFLTYRRTKTIDGDPGIQLKSYLADTVTVPQALLTSSESKSFALPPALQDPPAAASNAPNAPQVTASRSVRARLRAGRRGRLVVSGAAPTGSKLVVRLRRNGKTVRAKHVTARRGGFGVRFTVRRSLRYSALVTGAVKGHKIRVVVRSVRARLR